MTEATAAKWRAFYDRFAPALVLFILFVSMVGIWIGVASIQNDARQDAAAAAENKARDHQNSSLLACFDEFADNLAGGLPPVRAASADRDSALAAAIGQLHRLIVKAVGGDEATDADIDDLLNAFEAYKKASDKLDDVRANNPYPEPPSEFCSPKVLAGT